MNLKHGAFSKRTRRCEAPGCGREYVAQRLTSRFCSRECQTEFGRWAWNNNRGRRAAKASS
jgi:hypothetical protein